MGHRHWIFQILEPNDPEQSSTVYIKSMSKFELINTV